MVADALNQVIPRAFADAASQVRSRTLANGLTLLVWPNHNIPSVSLHNWVRAGSRNEGGGRTGLAHFFEYMMFNGTSRHARGEFDRLMEAQGGSNNAFTSQDVTVYQDWFPRSALELVFELESDRIANLAFEPAVVENERKVVFSERRMRVDQVSPPVGSNDRSGCRESLTLNSSSSAAGVFAESASDGESVTLDTASVG